MSGHPRTTKTAPSGQKRALLPEQVVKAKKPAPASDLPLPRLEAEVPKEPRKGMMEEEEDDAETKGQHDENRGPTVVGVHHRHLGP